MSWQVTAVSVPSKDPEAAEQLLRRALNGTPSATGAEVEVGDQKEAALAAALTLLTACGTGPCKVAFAGHANEGHGKTEAYANEAISVTVNEH